MTNIRESRRTGRTRRQLAAWALAALTGLSILATAATSAAASVPSGTYVSTTAPVHFCIDWNLTACSQANWAVPVNSPVTMVCWQKGSWEVGEYGTDMWFVVRYGDREGWVHASRVKQQSTVGYCGDLPRIRAELQAASRWNQVYADPATAALFSSADWSPGPYGEWSGDCAKLAWASWHLAGVNPAGGNAYQMYLTYARAGRVATTGTPPLGALVFFQIAMPYGHVAVSVGGGYVVTTEGMDGNRRPNSYRAISSYPNYLGWTLPA